MDRHTDDIRNVREGDTVQIETTEGEAFEAECIGYDVQHASPGSGEIRESRVWLFDSVEGRPVVPIIDGLKSSRDDPDFPIHKPIWDEERGEAMGYVKELIIHGKMET